MRIFLVIPTLTAGGAERVMSLLANHWAEVPDIEVHIALLVDDELFYELDKRVVIHKFGFPLKPSIFKRLVGFVNLAYSLRKTISKHKPDFVLSFMNKYNVFTIVSLLGSRFKVFVSERDSPTEKIPKLRELFRNITYKYASGVITQTESSKLFIEKETGNYNVTVIPNPIKLIEIDKSIQKEKIILNIGRLVQKKGQKYLIEAFSKLDCLDWKIVFIGDGPLKADLKSLSQKLGISNSVIFLGTVKDVDLWLNKASIFVFPSILEGFPNALAEAMSAGLPCVSFDCETGPRELINDGHNGFLVDVGDVENLSNKIKLLQLNEGLRNEISMAAVTVRERLGIKKIADNFLKFCTK